MFYVMANRPNPINYTQNSGFPSVISWRAVDYMKVMRWAENEFPQIS